MTLVQRPTPYFDTDLERWEHTALRRRMLEGTWKADLELAVLRELGPVRRDAWGNADISNNLFRASAVQLAALYDEPGVIVHQDSAAKVEMTQLLLHGGYWQIMQRAQRDCIGMREILVVPYVEKTGESDESVEIRFRVVPPDLVCARAAHEDPDEPVWLAEASQRDGVWGWDIWSVENPQNPSYHREDSRRNKLDGTERSGTSYPYRYADGKPYIPHVLYHATRTGGLWDPFENRELVEGTITLGILWTFFVHCVRNTSWPQRWILNARPAGGRTAGTGESARQSVDADPAAVVELAPVEEGVQPQVGQWSTASDPEALQTAISAYARQLAINTGVAPSDAQRGDARSGFALAVNREAQRIAQRKYGPSFSRGDVAMLRRIAAMVKNYNGVALPEKGWNIQYAAIPPSPDERADARAEIQAGIERGTVSVVDVYMDEHPGTSREAALVELRRIAAERALIAASPMSTELLDLIRQVEAGTVDVTRLPGIVRAIAARAFTPPTPPPAPGVA